MPALFMSQLKELHISCDMRLPVDELVLMEEEYNFTGEGKLHPDDESLINEDIMLE